MLVIPTLRRLSQKDHKFPKAVLTTESDPIAKTTGRELGLWLNGRKLVHLVPLV